MVVNWVDEIVDQMTTCWDESMTVTSVGLRADKMVEITALKRVGYMAMNWVG